MKKELYITHSGAFDPNTLLLTEQGIAFATYLDSFFKNIPVNHIIASTPLSYIQTAWQVAATKRIDIHTFNDRNFRNLVAVAGFTRQLTFPYDSACLMVAKYEDFNCILHALKIQEVKASDHELFYGTIIRLSYKNYNYSVSYEKWDAIPA